MSSKYIQDYDVPNNFIEILHDYTREILRDQPEDIIQYSSNYFEALRTVRINNFDLLKGASFKYVSKYNIHRTKQISHRKFEYSAHQNYKTENDEIGVKSVPPVRKKFLHIDQPQQNKQKDTKDMQTIQTSLEKQEKSQIQTEQKRNLPQKIEETNKIQRIQEPERIKEEQPQQEVQKIVQEEQKESKASDKILGFIKNAPDEIIKKANESSDNLPRSIEGVDINQEQLQKEVLEEEEKVIQEKQPKASDKILGFLKNAPGEIVKKSNESSDNLRRSMEGVDINQQELQKKVQEEQNIPEESSKASDKILGFLKNAPGEIAKKATESSNNLRRSIEGIENNEEELFLQINVMQALGLPFNQQDTRCCLLLGEKRQETKIIYNESEPKWNEIIMFSKIQQEELLNNELKITLLQDVDACIGQVDVPITEEDISKEGQFFLNKYIEVPNKLTDKKVFVHLQIRVGKEGKEYEVTQFAEAVQDEEETIRKAIAIEYQEEK